MTIPLEGPWAEDAHSFNYQGLFLNVLEGMGRLKVGTS
jgi:hypothetical protein